MMNNKIIFTFNSHRTFNNALSKSFVNELSTKRNISYADDEFVMYYKNDFKIVIDSLLSVYISSENFTGYLDNVISMVKKEYEFLCTMNKNLDKNTSIEISLSKGNLPMINDYYVFEDLDDYLFLTV